MNRFVIPLVAFLLLVGFLGIGLTLNPKELPSPLLNKPAPDFSLPRLLDSQNFKPEQMQGEVWLLNVWASWCVACLDEHAHITDLAQTNTIRIVGLNYKDEATEATEWLQRFGNPYSYIPIDQNGDVGIDYGVYGVPETYLIDKIGRIRFKQVGPLDGDIVQRILIPMIQQLREEVI